MPILPQQETIVQYITSSSQFVYTFAFYAPLPTDIKIYYQAANATPIPATDILALGSQYTVTYNADPISGGFITLLFTPVTGYYLTINRQVMASLITNFANAQTFNGANLDAALDRLLLLCQQNQNYNLERNLSYVINTYLPNAAPFTQLPPLPQNYFWVGSGSGVVAAQVAAVPSASVLQSLLASNAPGTDGALLVGYYDFVHSFPTTVDQFLNYNCVSAIDSSITQNSIQVTLASNYVLKDGNRLAVQIAIANSGPCTLAINAGIPILIVKYNGIGVYVPLTQADLSNGGTYEFIYNASGNAWLLVNPNPALFYGGSVYQSSNQVIGSGNTVVVTFNAVDFDPNLIFSFSNNRFIPLKRGYYLVTGIVQIVPTNPNTGAVALDIYKNSALWVPLDLQLASSTMTMGASFTMFMNGTTDYVQLVFANSTTGVVTLTSGGLFNNFQINYLGGG